MSGWNHRYSEFEDGHLVHQRNGDWRLTIEKVCGGSNCGPRNGVAHVHRSTDAIEAQDAVNLLVDWEIDIEDTEGLEDFRHSQVSLQILNEEGSADDDAESTRKVFCFECPSGFANSADLREHILAHHGV